jgi:hypothetical protein
VKKRGDGAGGLHGRIAGAPGLAHDERLGLVVDAHLHRLPAGHCVLAGGAQEGGDGPDLRSGADAIRGATDARGDHRGPDREDREDDHQLHEGEAPRH